MADDDALLPLPLDAALPEAVAVDDDALTPEAAEAVQRGLAEATHRAYDEDWKKFTAWCAAQGRTPMPATGATLASFVTDLTRTTDLSPASIERVLGSIQGRRQAADLATNAKAARMVIKGHRREWAQAGGRRKRAHAITTADLRAMLATRPENTLAHLRDRALVLLGYTMLARRSELSVLDVADLSFTEDGLEVFIATSKTDTASAGALVQVTYGTHRLTCAVRTARAYTDALAAAGVTSGPLLRGVDRHGRPAGTPDTLIRGTGRMSGDGINRAVKAMAADAGLEGVSAHSLRSGPATATARRGVDRSEIAAQGRWAESSTAINAYIRPARGWEHNMLRKLDL
ncbi:tyrosine-type recombinase/integrase [Nocardiopsis sp. RSe5-2]|uniref:Tyrosine-type recombinase/integrase n=1 Tax=Nocardiopsis endophytica TaxID=3018445 RepID=A0ABT4U0K1_9ACTN|nr:tyrosine-type recombinase/integrase [Nocardiopsis endophytica]MDA2809892.1 tyrosine-type recombinase/integrase [Nocardiopsis endophytica]